MKQELSGLSQMNRYIFGLVLVPLVMQNAGLALVTKHTFRVGVARYEPATVVFMAELLKAVLSAFACKLLPQSEKMQTSSKGKAQFLLLLPSSLYVFQNNLQMYAVKHLTATTFIVCSQLKIVTTAIFSSIFLGFRLSRVRLLSIVMLTMGVTLVQTHNLVSTEAQSSSTGLAAVLTAVAISGLAGVLLEFIYKEHDSSIWTKNFHLSLLSLPIAWLAALRSVNSSSSTQEFFYGYDQYVVLVVVLQAIGGLLVAAVLKYADSVIKCFAVSTSILLVHLHGIGSGREVINVTQMFGVCLVVVALHGYSAW